MFENRKNTTSHLTYMNACLYKKKCIKNIVSLTKVNKETISTILVFHPEEAEVSLFLLTPLHLWTLSKCSTGSKSMQNYNLSAECRESKNINDLKSGKTNRVSVFSVTESISLPRQLLLWVLFRIG